MYCLTVKKVGNDRKVTSDILEDLAEKKILLIEDILETGKSMLAAKNYLEEKGAIVKTACLYTLSISELKPDFNLREIKKIINFPWEMS